MSEELRGILVRFAECGWDLIGAPLRAYLEGTLDRDALAGVIRRAGEQVRRAAAASWIRCISGRWSGCIEKRSEGACLRSLFLDVRPAILPGP